ncbi:MAG TPA: prepilin-type N-terminal cleavage/methylation domain-containing protein, partial [Bacillota bacterium]|nr:prepilin-type N-terminal cleavage/methylation domain-containing protein [Bacillota bacterium]
MTKPIVRSRVGFTLLELLIVMGLMSLLLSLVSTFFLHAYAANKRIALNRLVQSDLRFAADYVAREMREAVSVTAVTDNGRKISYTTVQGSNLVTRHFQQSGSTIQRYDNQPLCQYVSRVRFSFDPETLLVTIEIEGVTTPTLRGSGV